LRALLATAIERSPWHWAGGLDIATSDGDIVDAGDDQTDLMDNFDAIVTDPRLSRRCAKTISTRTPETIC
jgi:hypothetical protein